MATVSGVSPTYLASAALGRAAELMKILDREHTHVELYHRMRGVRHELETAIRFMPTRARPGNRATSARRAHGSTPGSARHNILLMLQEGPATSIQLARQAGLKVAVVRSRLVELASASWVEVSGKTLDQGTKRNNGTWRMTDAGRKALGELQSGQMALIEV